MKKRQSGNFIKIGKTILTFLGKTKQSFQKPIPNTHAWKKYGTWSTHSREILFALGGKSLQF